MTGLPDSTLVEKINKGNKQAFDQLFFKYYNPLVRFAYSFCKNKIIAEESVQQVFIKIWKNDSLQTSNEIIGKLLFTSTHNQVIDEIRKENARKKYEGNIEEIVVDSIKEKDSEEKLRAKAIIDCAIDTLPEKTKEIFKLAKHEGLSMDEIADYLKISQKTVENQIGNAYKKIRQYLLPYKEILN